jgi:threonine/homoserine/homoserine lactone efflux protein
LFVIGLDRLAVFVTTVTVLIAVPGPSVLFVVSRGVALGPRAAVSTAVGNEAGLLVQVVLVAFGLSEVLQHSSLAFSVLKFAGALYLVYLGVQTWRQRRSLTVREEATPRAGRPSRVLREGFVVGVSNPKGLLIFGAVLPQFVDRQAGNAHVQLLLLGLICVMIALISDATWGLLAGSARRWLTRSPRRLSWIGAASGAVMVGLGIRLALSDRE